MIKTILLAIFAGNAIYLIAAGVWSYLKEKDAEENRDMEFPGDEEEWNI